MYCNWNDEVRLSVLKQHKDWVVKTLLETRSISHNRPSKQLHVFALSLSSTAGELLLKKLVANGVAHDLYWEDDALTEEGTTQIRFTDTGELITKTILECTGRPSIFTLMGLIDEPEKLKSYLLSIKEQVTPLSWERQYENGKLYQTVQLITPK